MATVATHPPAPDEPWWSTEFQLPGSPFRAELRFTEFQTDGGPELVLSGFALVQPDPRDTESPEEFKSIGQAVIRDLANRWTLLERTARQHIELFTGTTVQTKTMRQRRELSDAFLARMVSRHRELRESGVAPTKALAREEAVSPSTVKNWMAVARKRKIEAS
jgi:hypothetical protein